MTSQEIKHSQDALIKDMAAIQRSLTGGAFPVLTESRKDAAALRVAVLEVALQLALTREAQEQKPDRSYFHFEDPLKPPAWRANPTDTASGPPNPDNSSGGPTK